MTDSLATFEAAWHNSPQHHAAVRDAFVDAVNADADLNAHRTHVENHVLGFGERAFHHLWKLLVAEMPPAFKFLEIGVFRGQTTSLIGLLAKKADKRVGVVGLSAYDGTGLEWEPRDYEPEVHALFNQYSDDHAILTTVRGDSTTPDAIQWGQELGPYDIVYIDGGHTYDIAKSDILNYAPLIKQGGYLVIDDCANRFDMPFGFFCGIQEVSQAVDDLLPLFGEGTLPDGSMWKHVGSVVHIRLWRRLL